MLTFSPQFDFYYPPAPPPTVFAPPTILQPQDNASPILATALNTPSSHFTLQVGEPCIIFPPKGLRLPPKVGEPFDQLSCIILVKLDVRKIHFQNGRGCISNKEKHQFGFSQMNLCQSCTSGLTTH